MPSQTSRAGSALVTVAGVASLFGLLAPSACSSGSSASSGSCVDFTVSADDLACTTSSDCAWIDELHVCPGDPSCGGEIPVNVAAEARFRSATGGVSRTQVECGAPSPVGCVNHVCTTVGLGDAGVPEASTADGAGGS
jgi:hypothetical protein